MAHPQIDNRTLFTGDNLDVMRSLNSESVDLIYLDPPFNKKIVFPIGKDDNKEFGYKDIWGWNSKLDKRNPFLPYAELYAFGELIASQNNDNPLINSAMAKKIVCFLETMGELEGHAEMAYLSFMAARLVEMQRLLKPTGSIYLHCDPTMSHSLKLLIDIIFGSGNFRNEIIWAYTGPGSPNMKQFPRKHDSIFWYSKGNRWVFNREQLRVPYKDPRQTLRRAMDAGKGLGKDEIEKYRERGKLMENWWDDIALAVRSPHERTGYPTQKPVALLERIITASSNKNDFVLDPFCGCATTCIAAERLNREWCGIDIASHAADLVRHRLLEETKQGKLGSKVPKIYHRKLDKGKYPIRTDLGEKRSKDIDIKRILYGIQEGKCNLCKRLFEIRDFHIDHIMPKHKGGPDVDKNLQLLCGSCNSIKGTRSMETARERLRELGHMIKAA